MPGFWVINEPWELKPLDAVEEGIFIRELICSKVYGKVDRWEWKLHQLYYEDAEVNGQVWHRVIWGEPLEKPMQFPMTVMRGVLPPKLKRVLGEDREDLWDTLQVISKMPQ